jgi:protein-L-isoaspartate(D-aspartate) O-methyltransferase
VPISALDQMLADVSRQVRDPRVLAAMRKVPRHRFVPIDQRPSAYEDHALPIGNDQTISQPTIVGLMTEAAHLTGEERVLEIGTGSGYQAAVLSHLAREVVTVELVDELRERAAALLTDLGYQNVTVLAADHDLGAPSLGPYDVILVTAAAPAIPPPLIEQLLIGGRIIIPVGTRWSQQLIVATRHAESIEEESLGGCRFVPLLGPHGFKD